MDGGDFGTVIPFTAVGTVNQERGIEYMSRSVNFSSLPVKDDKGYSGVQLIFQDNNKNNLYKRTIIGGECSIGSDNEIQLQVDGNKVLLKEVFSNIPDWILGDGPIVEQENTTKQAAANLLSA